MIGIVVDNISSDVKNYVMFRELNKLSETHNCFVFTNQIAGLPMNNKFAILQQVEALSHSGVLIATNLMNAQIVRNSLTASKKYFYVYDLDWTKISQFHSKQLTNIFYNDEMELISRSKSHSDILTKLFKKPKSVVYNWNNKELIEAIS